MVHFQQFYQQLEDLLVLLVLHLQKLSNPPLGLLWDLIHELHFEGTLETLILEVDEILMDFCSLECLNHLLPGLLLLELTQIWLDFLR
jgi:hypothetical protein